VLFPEDEYFGLALGFFCEHILVFKGIIIYFDKALNTSIPTMNVIKKLHRLKA